MDWKKLLPSLLPVLAVVASAFTDQISAYIATHPSIALVLMTASTVLANVLNPTKKPAA